MDKKYTNNVLYKELQLREKYITELEKKIKNIKDTNKKSISRIKILENKFLDLKTENK